MQEFCTKNQIYVDFCKKDLLFAFHFCLSFFPLFCIKAGVGSPLSQLQNNMSLIIFALLLYISTLQNHLSHSKIWMALKIVVPLQWILEQNLLQKSD